LVARCKFIQIGISFERPLIKLFITQGAAFGIARFFSIMYTNVDTTMLSLMVGDAEVGWYNAAYRLIFAMMVIPMGIMRAVYPALSLYYEQKSPAFAELFDKTIKLLFWVGTAVATVLFCLADKIILLIFREQFINAAGALKILVWSTAIYFIGTVMTHTTRAVGKQGFTAKVVATSAILNLVLNFIFIPRFSYIGAAFATLISEFFTFSFHFWYVRKNLVKPALLRLAPKVLLIDGVTALSIWLFYDYNLFIILAVSMIIQIFMVLITKYFSKEELLRIKVMVKN
jgi:O-antigen/teichoic acid export membrane protein